MKRAKDQCQIIFVIFLFTLSDYSSCEESWTGRWFPVRVEPTTESNVKNVTSANQDWNGKWFPHTPTTTGSIENDRVMGIPNADCDDGETNLRNDFDPHSYEHSIFYTCIEPQTYKPNYDVEPLLTTHDVPKFYTPMHKCMNDKIAYDERVPTLGFHRPLWAAFGDYIYLPPQRWLHNLEHGSIVMLYHPCANKMQIEKLKTLVKGCLRRHVITPYNKLSPERPFALVAWATSLEFSVLEKSVAVNFIRKYAKTGPEKVSRDGQYSLLLTEKAKTISDIDDFELCPNVT